VSGKYLEDCSIIKSSKFSYDSQVQTQLWNKTWHYLIDDNWINIRDQKLGLPDPFITDFK